MIGCQSTFAFHEVIAHQVHEDGVDILDATHVMTVSDDGQVYQALKGAAIETSPSNCADAPLLGDCLLYTSDAADDLI